MANLLFFWGIAFFQELGSNFYYMLLWLSELSTFIL